MRSILGHKKGVGGEEGATPLLKEEGNFNSSLPGYMKNKLSQMNLISFNEFVS